MKSKTPKSRHYSIQESVCNRCGRVFIVQGHSTWVYHARIKGDITGSTTVPVCSWTCHKESEADYESKRLKKHRSMNRGY